MYRSAVARRCVREMKLRWDDDAESDPNISMKVSVRSRLELRLSGESR